jgi:hypothetical protein
MCLSVLLLVVLLAGCAGTPVRLADDPAAVWPGRCETIRGDLLAEPSARVTVAPRPAGSGSTPYWVIVVDGLPAPVPPLRYRDVLVAPSPFPGGIPTVVLAGEDGSTAVTISSLAAPAAYEDLFAMVGEGPTPEGRALTRRLFGGPVAHERLLEAGYAGRPEDLTCRPEHWEREIPLAVALILKASEGGLEAAYEGIGGRRGWVTRSAGRGNTVLWQATLPGAERWIILGVRVNADGPFRDAGLAFGRPDMVRAAGRPVWLAPLAAVLDDPRNGELWKVLAEALEAAGFPEESVARIRRSTPGAGR